MHFTEYPSAPDSSGRSISIVCPKYLYLGLSVPLIVLVPFLFFSFTTYGGELTLFDFDGKHTLKTMADKIMRDLAFDKQCKKNIELREKAKKYKKDKFVCFVKNCLFINSLLKKI